MRKLICTAAAIVGLFGLSACARGGGIGLEAMLADHNCEQQGFHLGTKEYAACRMGYSRQFAINDAALAAYNQRQIELNMQQMQQMPRLQTCRYNSTTFGNMTTGTANCM